MQALAPVIKRARSKDAFQIALHPKIGNKFTLAMRVIASKFYEAWTIARKEEDECGASVNSSDILDEVLNVDATSLPKSVKSEFISAFAEKVVFRLVCFDVEVRKSMHDNSLEYVSFETNFGNKVIQADQLVNIHVGAEKEEEMVFQFVETGKGGKKRYLVPASVVSFHS